MTKILNIVFMCSSYCWCLPNLTPTSQHHLPVPNSSTVHVRDTAGSTVTHHSVAHHRNWAIGAAEKNLRQGARETDCSKGCIFKSQNNTFIGIHFNFSMKVKRDYLEVFLYQHY